MLRIVARLSAARARDAAQIAPQQRDARAFHRHVRAGSHCDSDVRLRKRRRIVNAVAGHGDDVALPLAAS